LFTFLLVACGTAFAEEKAGAQGDAKDKAVVSEQRQPAKAEETPGVTGTASLGVYNKYIFRGYELSRKSVVFQPGLSASYNGFTASWWGNIDSREHATQNFVPDRDKQRSFNETDLTLSYTYTKDKLSLTGGWIYYGLKYADETQEVFGSIAYDVIGKPALTIYRDIDRYPGTYFNLSFAHSIKVYKETTLDLGASFGYMWGDGDFWKTYERATEDYTGSKYSAFHDGMVKAALTIPVTKKVTFVPLVQYWFPLSGNASRKIGTSSYNPNGYLGTNFVGGASINYNF
jgi:hypothetical protein